MKKTITITVETKEGTDVGVMKTSQSGFTSDYEVIGALEAVKKTILEGNYDMAIRKMSESLFQPDSEKSNKTT